MTRFRWKLFLVELGLCVFPTLCGVRAARRLRGTPPGAIPDFLPRDREEVAAMILVLGGAALLALWAVRS